MTTTPGLDPAIQTVLNSAQAAVSNAKQVSVHAQAVLAQLEQELQAAEVKEAAIEKTLQEEVNTIVQEMDMNVLKFLVQSPNPQ